MEAVTLTYLEAIDILELGLSLFDMEYKLMRRRHLDDLFFLVEETPQTFYML